MTCFGGMPAFSSSIFNAGECLGCFVIYHAHVDALVKADLKPAFPDIPDMIMPSGNAEKVVVQNMQFFRMPPAAP